MLRVIAMLPAGQRTIRVAAFALLLLADGCVAMKHVYLAEGISGLSYRDRGISPALDVRTGFALDAVPTWAFGGSFTHSRAKDSVGYFEPKCFTYRNDKKQQTGCHPRIVTSSAGLDVQKRWTPTRVVHPFASAIVGRVTTGNVYQSSAASYSGVMDSARTAGFASLAGGGELNLANWLHLTVSAGYRAVTSQNVTSGIVSPSGFTVTSLLVLGKPYRTP